MTNSGRTWCRSTGAVTAVALVAFLVSGCAGGSGSSTSMPSDPRPTATDGSSGTGPGGGPTEPASAEFCERVRAPGSGPDQSPEALLAWLGDLREVAPAGLVDDIDVLAGMVGTLESLEENDPASLGRVLETLLDPAAAEATRNLAQVARDDCGVVLEGGLGAFGDGSGADGADGSAGDEPAGDAPGEVPGD